MRTHYQSLMARIQKRIREKELKSRIDLKYQAESYREIAKLFIICGRLSLMTAKKLEKEFNK